MQYLSWSLHIVDLLMTRMFDTHKNYLSPHDGKIQTTRLLSSLSIMFRFSMI